MAETYSPREMIEKLVAFDTTSRNSNLGLIEFVEDYLAPFGGRCQRIYNDDKSKANLLASIGPDVEGGIILSGHTDVVPVDGQPWVTDPWTVTEKDGKLFGRGTSDMKSFSAIALALVPEFIQRGLKVPLHFTLSYDEEIGCIGVHGLVEEIPNAIKAPRCALIGEPTHMKVVSANKGIRQFRTTVEGKEGHSSLPAGGANSILYAVELINHLVDLKQVMIDKGDSSGRFDPPYTTVSVGVIEGGTATNIIPRVCSFDWEYRPLPQEDPDLIRNEFLSHVEKIVLPRLKREAGEDGAITTQDIVQVPGLVGEPDNEAEALALRLTGANRTESVSYAAEAGIFHDAGVPSVICGPGAIEVAHQPNEFITLEQVDLSIQFFRKLMDEICG